MAALRENREAVIVEFELTGTRLAPFLGLAATGRAFSGCMVDPATIRTGPGLPAGPA